MIVKTFRFAAIMLTAFSLSLSMTHLLEFPQRMKFDQELWVRVTVFENLYTLFGSVGAVFEIGAILTAFAQRNILDADHLVLSKSDAGKTAFFRRRISVELLRLERSRKGKGQAH